jgi:acyl carrier protein
MRQSGAVSSGCDEEALAIHHVFAEALWLIGCRVTPLQAGQNAMSTRSRILQAMQEIAAAQKKTLSPLTDHLALTNSGLDSLCFALLVARLEDETGRDPFSQSDEVSFPVTLGEFIALYDHVPA